MKRVLFAPALLVVALQSACDGVLFTDPEDVFLRVDRSVYAAGDTATLRLVNDSGETIGYNLCVHLVQRRIGDDWVDTLYGHEGPCVAMLYLLQHDESDTAPAALDPGTPAGTYRFRTRVEGSREQFTVYSDAFVVE